MSSFCKCKSYSHFFSKNISIYAIFNDQSFNDMLTNDIVSFEQLGPGDNEAVHNEVMSWTLPPAGFVRLFLLRFYSPVKPMGSCRARSVYLTTRLLGRLSLLSS